MKKLKLDTGSRMRKKPCAAGCGRLSFFVLPRRRPVTLPLGNRWHGLLREYATVCQYDECEAKIYADTSWTACTEEHDSTGQCPIDDGPPYEAEET